MTPATQQPQAAEDTVKVIHSEAFLTNRLITKCFAGKGNTNSEDHEYEALRKTKGVYMSKDQCLHAVKKHKKTTILCSLRFVASSYEHKIMYMNNIWSGAKRKVKHCQKLSKSSYGDLEYPYQLSWPAVVMVLSHSQPTADASCWSVCHKLTN